MRSNPFPSIPPSNGSPGRDPGSRGACAFLGAFYAPRGRLALGGFKGGDHDDFDEDIDFVGFLWVRGVIDFGDADGSEEFAEHLDNQQW